MTAPARPVLLTDDLDWILFGGKGGVGKTTCAVATALFRARHADAPVYLLSTDPAHSLRDSLGPETPASLHVRAFDAEAALDAFRDEHRAALHEIVAHGTLFDDDDIGRLLDLGLPGMDEVMAFLHLATLLEDPDVETVILDTAPTGHTLRLLDAPQVFKTWLGVLDAMLEKHRTLRATFGRADGPDALDQFLLDLQGRADRVLDVLRDPERCQFVVVTRPESLVLAETDRLLAHLDRRSISTSTLLVNCYPWTDRGPDTSGRSFRRLQAHADAFASLDAWAVPDYEAEVQGIERLERLWRDAAPLDLTADLDEETRSEGTARAEPTVLRSVPAPAESLLLFAGKGGVGKTTLACATALFCADRGEASTLLLSTDPAHSLSTALEVDLDDAPTSVAPGLDALEVDAPARFDALRRDYVDEVRQFFRDRTAPGVDLPYDRPVMERLLDLAPPGVDETMGWTAALDALDGDYDTCMLDAAPTGHFVRLLEMPRLFEEWLQAFFRILRKYRQVVRLPRLSDRLVRLSKQVKALRRMLEEENTGAVCGVTLPARMAWAETEDLLAAAARLGVSVPVLFLNRVPRATAPQWIAACEQRFDGQRVGAVAEGAAAPRGIEALRQLGTALYD